MMSARVNVSLDIGNRKTCVKILEVHLCCSDIFVYINDDIKVRLLLGFSTGHIPILNVQQTEV